MTNKEKAREISKKHKIEYSAVVLNCHRILSSDSECFGSALEMAEWKDQQFKEYLERKKREFPNYCNGFLAKHYDACITFLEQIINELFPEQEQDNSDNDE